MLKRNTQLAVAICAVVAITAVAAAAQEGDGTSAPPGDGVVQVTTVEPAARNAASVLARSRESGDALPADLAERMSAQPKFGMNPSLSRRAIGMVSSSLYLLPARDHVCAALTLGQGANLTCAETSDLAAGESGPATVLLPGGAIAIYGIVPDGVDTVDVSTGQPGPGVAKVVDNAFLTVVPGGTALKAVSYDGPSGGVEFPIYDPSAG